MNTKTNHGAEIPLFASEPDKCDGTRCTHHNDCRADDSGWLCSLPKGHAGPHIACGITHHNIHTWPQ